MINIEIFNYLFNDNTPAISSIWTCIMRLCVNGYKSNTTELKDKTENLLASIYFLDMET